MVDCSQLVILNDTETDFCQTKNSEQTSFKRSHMWLLSFLSSMVSLPSRCYLKRLVCAAYFWVIFIKSAETVLFRVNPQALNKEMCCPSSFNNWLHDPELNPHSRKYSKDSNFESGVLLKFVRRPWGVRTQARLREQI